jgi:hypothetical protein
VSEQTKTKRRFVITGDAWYARSAMIGWGHGVVAEMSCGLDPVDEDGNDLGGTCGEWRVVWKEITPGRPPFVQVEVFDDGWKQFVESEFHEVMAALAGSSPTVEQLATALAERGWVDCTDRVGAAR